jgi:hypothetical protein
MTVASRGTYRRVDRFEQLPDRTQKIVRARLNDLTMGRSRHHTAHTLALSVGTIDNEMHRAYSMLGIHSREGHHWMRQQLRAHIAEADKRAAAPAVIAAIDRELEEIYQLCARIDDDLATEGVGSEFLHLRLKLVVATAHARLRELRGEQPPKSDREAA